MQWTAVTLHALIDAANSTTKSSQRPPTRKMPVVINRQGKLALVDGPISHFLPPAPTPPSQHHVVRRTIYRRHSANAAMAGAYDRAQNYAYAHLGGLPGVVDNSTLQNGYVVVTTRRFSLPASRTSSHAGHGGDPRYAGAGFRPTFLRTTPVPLHSPMHINANAQTHASNQAYHAVLRDDRTSTDCTTSIDAVHAPDSDIFTSTPSSMSSTILQQPNDHRYNEKTPSIVPNVSMDKLRELMTKSNDSMKNLEKFEGRQGLRRCDAQNMVKTARSRKQLLDNKILSKWDGSPLIAFHRQADGSVKVLAGPSNARKKHTCRRVNRRM